MTALAFEGVLPYLTTTIVVVVWYFWLGAVFPSKPDNLLLETGTAAAVLIGFLATAKAIVLGLANSPIFRSLKETGYSNILFRYFFEAVVAGTLLLIASVIGFFFPESGPPKWFEVVWIAVATAAITNYLRVVGVLFKLIKQA
jgi:hypothetical protein